MWVPSFKPSCHFHVLLDYKKESSSTVTWLCYMQIASGTRSPSYILYTWKGNLAGLGNGALSLSCPKIKQTKKSKFYFSCICFKNNIVFIFLSRVIVLTKWNPCILLSPSVSLGRGIPHSFFQLWLQSARVVCIHPCSLLFLLFMSSFHPYT